MLLSDYSHTSVDDVAPYASDDVSDISLWPREPLLIDLLLVGDKGTARGSVLVFLKRTGTS